MKIYKNFHCFVALSFAVAVCTNALGQSSPSLGVQLCAGVRINGTNAGLYAVQANSNLANSNGWVCVGLVQLPVTNYFWADTNAVAGQLFYRLVSRSTNLVWIQPGTFTMGSPTNEALRGTDEVQHVVTITKGFYMGKFLVTQAEYLATTGGNPSYFASPQLPDDFQRPVDTISWVDATNYCALRTAKEQAAGMIPTNWVYRLPTESEWEYACRAGTVTALYLGNALHSQQANFAGTNEYDSVAGSMVNPSGVVLGATTEGGSYAPNGWGLYDMAGNLLEWCQDWYGAYPSASVIDPQGAVTGTQKVRRGSYYGAGGDACRSSRRASEVPTGGPIRNDSFRVVLAPKP